ncbi:MAG: hypothetical protein RI935_25 [Candidatus Parcubacteria bacterium]
MKAIIVARVSTDEQKENSPDAQIYRMERYCENKNLTIIERFSFVESAYKTKRDEFDKILSSVKSTKERVAICFDKVDRLSRNIFDKRVALLYEKAINNDIELHFVSDGQVIDSNISAGDKFAFGMKLGLSKYYSDAISDNVKRAFEQKRRNGEWTGSVRLGYLNVTLDESKRLRKDIIVDPERGHLIVRMFELYATGLYSLETIRLQMIDLGLRTLKGNKPSKSGIENLLKDSFYCGVAMSPKYGNFHHKYPRLISRELFDQCQDIRNGRNLRKHKSVSKEVLFKGLITCDRCGCTMTPEIKRKPSGKEYVFYSCTNAKKICERIYVNEKELLKPIYDILDRFQSISQETQDRLIKELKSTNQVESDFHKAQISRINSELDMIKIKQDKLLDAYLDERVTEEQFSQKQKEYSRQTGLLEIEASEYRKGDFSYQDTVAQIITISREAKDIFEKSSDVAGKRAFINSLIQNPTVNKKKLCFTIASPYNLVLELASTPNWLRGQGSNLRPTR